MPLVACRHPAYDLVLHDLVVHLVEVGRHVPDHAAAEDALLRPVGHLRDVEGLEGVPRGQPDLERGRRRRRAALVAGALRGPAALERALLQRGGLRGAAPQEPPLAVRPRRAGQGDAAAVHPRDHPAGLLLQVILWAELVDDAVALLRTVDLRHHGSQLRRPHGLVPVEREGRVPDGGAAPRGPRGEDVEAQGLHEQVDVRHAHPSVPCYPEGAQQPGDLLLGAAARADPLGDQREHLRFRRYGQVVLREDHHHEVDRELAPPMILRDRTQVPPLAQGAHQLLLQLLLVG
mmetsp:Transcript_15019/g.44471  ORF Transcript_15019/g.44471 Transcript_15019/m.44471 type:complete len:290 (-) Transcript_15019:410-1279(-)